MKPENKKENKPNRRKRKTSAFFLIPLLILFVVGLLFYISSRQEETTGTGQQVGIWRKITHAFSGNSEVKSNQQQSNQARSTEGNSHSDMNRKAGAGNTANMNTHGTDAATVQQQPNSPADEHEPSPQGDKLQTILSGPSKTCQQAADQVNAFYTHLDAQPYIQAFHLGKKSSVYFSELIQKLLDNPPVITRETDDLFTVLKNTSHFYRVIGKNNILILKTILDKEKPYIEDTLADFYSLLQHPDCLQKSFSITPPAYSIYDYAGFFLNTMGGRLYLFRRDSASRMTVTYYGIMVIEKANSESNNRDGIQIKKPIDSLITEMENSGNQLKLKDKYLDKLYDLKEKYQ